MCTMNFSKRTFLQTAGFGTLTTLLAPVMNAGGLTQTPAAPAAPAPGPITEKVAVDALQLLEVDQGLADLSQAAVNAAFAPAMTGGGSAAVRDQRP